MFVRKYLLPVFAVAGTTLAIFAVAQQAAPLHSQPAVALPATNPFAGSVSGAGTIEARSENIAVAPALGGVVKQVFVVWGQQVKAGDKLYQIDDQPMLAQITAQEADIAARRAAVEQSRANVARLQGEPRAEDLPISQARLAQAESNLADAKDQYDRMQNIANTQAMSSDDMNRRLFGYHQAQAAAEVAKADLAKLQAGAWKEDIAVAQSDLKAAESQVAAAEARVVPFKVDLDRLTVRAPIDGQVLRINVRPGEYVTAAGVGSASNASVVLGDVEHLHVRVDVDESDVPRFDPTAPAKAFIRGRSDIQVPLTFVRIDPFILPKANLTGSNTERVDTRVLQVIYSFDRGELPVYVGQQVDVFIGAPK